jgi:SSS family solute:Na+ symporter
VPTILGIVARARYPGLVNPELALPTILARDLPPLLGALGLAAVFTAEVNTADALLFMLSTSLSQDLYRRFLNPGASDAQVLRVARWAAIGGGALGVGLAVAAPSVIGVLSIFYTLLTVCLFVPVLGGLYVSRVGTAEALAAIVAGLTGSLGTILAGRLGAVGLPAPVIVGLGAGILGCVVTAVARRGHGSASGSSPTGSDSAA